MRKRLALVAAVTALGALVVAMTVGTASGSRQAGTILIGISAAKTGILAPYDLQSGQLFQMRINQINKAGGVLGKQIKVEWIDTKSDKPTAAANANELISKGAVVIIATCDFDFSFPAINAARSHKVPGIALCASSPKVATPAIVGPYGGSMGLGSDAEGATMAEWMHAKKPQWKRVYVFKDNSLEYSKATADYFKARWTQLGGKVCGEDTFVGGPNLDLSSQITRLRGKVKGCDAIFDGSWQPFGSQLIKAIRAAGINIPITTNASVNGVLVKQVAGNVSNFYAEGFACLPTYCNGTQTPLVRTIAKQFQATYHTPLGNHYALPGYALADAVVAAIKKAGSTDGPKIADALFGGKVTVNYFGTKMQFTPKCHRPQPAAYSIEQWTNGKDKQVDHWKVHFIPNIGDGSPCWGKPPAVR
ncbi:MAG TPA: ABC transporter substrate-binding protein [Gaiellaceae bacterium]|nr:ABC transporter substrate-binding protein [Gaiellaceae bacterium]